MSTGFVSLRGVNKYFDQVHAVANLDLDVNAGEFFSMLGPSGSGKTTVLRLIAGFESASSGRVVIESKVDMKKRGVASPDRAEAILLALYENKSVLPTFAPISIGQSNPWNMNL